MSSAASVADAALRLSPPDRAHVALLIMDSLPPDPWDENDILAEADRRDAEVESGRVKELTHEEFIAGLRSSRDRA
jgi:putative addiction module component (TIGR02574 family)